MGGRAPLEREGEGGPLGGTRGLQGKRRDEGISNASRRRSPSLAVAEPPMREGWRRQSGLGVGPREPGWACSRRSQEGLGRGTFQAEQAPEGGGGANHREGLWMCHGGWRAPLREEGAPGLQGCR